MSLLETEHKSRYMSTNTFTGQYYKPARSVQTSHIFDLLMPALLIVSVVWTHAIYAEQPIASSRSITFRLVESSGKPVCGAFVGTSAIWFDSNTREGSPRLVGVHYGTRPSRSRATNEKGEGTIAGEQLFRSNRVPGAEVTIVAVHEEKKLVSLTKVTEKDLGKIIEIPMQEACRVKGRLFSKGLEELGLPLDWTNVYVYWDDSIPFSCSSDYRRFEFLLPPGRYQIGSCGTETYEIRQELVVRPGQKEMELEIDLPANVLSALTGRSAPEFQEIKGWKNGGPVGFSELRGKVVLLDFWGYWCAPCVRKMPKLIELHNKYAKKGLVVVGVHDGSLGSLKELEAKMKQLEEKSWGRDLPFLIALDGGGKRPIKGTNLTALGATTAAYGIDAFPTTILIDKSGRVVGKFNVNRTADIRKLEVLLGLAEDSTGITSGSYELDPAIYKLRENETLKYIDIDKARVQVRPDSGGAFYFTGFRWIDGEEIRSDGSMFQQVLLEDVLRSVIGLSKYEYQGPEDVITALVDGDWIVRPEASEREKMQALARIVRKELKLPISIVHRVEQKDVIVARGRFKLQPLSGTHDDSQIHVYGEGLNLEGRGFHSGGNLQELLDRVAERIVEKPIVNLAEPSKANEYNYTWLFHRPSSFIEGLSPDQKEKKVQLILDNLSKHISLTFTKEQRSFDVWYISDTVD